MLRIPSNASVPRGRHVSFSGGWKRRAGGRVVAGVEKGCVGVRFSTGMSMVLSKWIITPIKVGCKSHK